MRLNSSFSLSNEMGMDNFWSNLTGMSVLATQPPWQCQARKAWLMALASGSLEVKHKKTRVLEFS